jgi:DNA polymerase-1
MQTAKIITKTLGIPVLEGEEFEADDYAGTLAKTFEDIEPIKLLTKDRDYFQLLTENIHGWILQSPAKIEELVAKYGPSASCPLGCYEYSPKTVLSEIGVKPYQIADWKGISGDPSDNIPGIKGVSDKTAIPLLKEYKTLEGINQAILKACATEEGKKSLLSYWKSLGIKRDPLQLMMEGMEKGIFCKNLAVIKTDVPIDNKLQSYVTPSFQNEQGLYGKFTEIALQYGMLPLQEEIGLFQKENMEEITEEMERE